GPGFAAQADLSALFVERALTLLRPGGTVSLLLPAKLWRALAGGGVRRLLAAEAAVTVLEDWSRSPHAFDASVYPSLLVAVRPIEEVQPAGRHGDRTCDGQPVEAGSDGRRPRRAPRNRHVQGVPGAPAAEP